MKDWKWRLQDVLEKYSYNGIKNIEEYSEICEVVEQELSKAREEGYQNCVDDIWEEARGLRSWTEHDGSISSADIEAGLQEAYLSIEAKLKNNK